MERKQKTEAFQKLWGKYKYVLLVSVLSSIAAVMP